MKNDFLNIFKEDFLCKISLIFILLFPIILLSGSAIINSSIVLTNIFFLIHIIREKKIYIFKNNIFYLLLAFWLFLIINTLLNNDFNQNYSRSFGFIRFIILIFLFEYFFSYKNYKFKKLIFNFWTLIFAIISSDLIFEYIFGFNTFGFETPYYGRLAGFMGDQLKIGHWYTCFSLIVLANSLKNNNKTFYFLLLLSIIVSFLIGERANFIRLFIATTFLVIFVQNFSFKFFTSASVVVFSIFFIISLSNEVILAKIKNRYVDQIYNVLKNDSIKKINNNFENTYTPMYFNAYDLFKKNKLLGIGVGSYLKKSHENYNINSEINGYRILPNTHPHQYHFEILATVGLPGYLFIVIFLLFFLFKSLRFYLKIRNPINLCSFLFVFVFCIPLLPTGSFFTTYGASMFWLNFSIMNLGNFKNLDY